MQQETGSLRQLALHGTLATAAAQAIRVALQLLTVILLSRWLKPADFGLVAMVMPVVALVSLFQDFGLQQAVIQRRAISAAEQTRLFYINLAAALAVIVVLLILSPLVAAFYRQPQVALLAAAWAVPIALGALAAQHLALLSREGRFGTLSAIDVAAAVSGFLVSAGSAFIWRSYWAIWAGTAVAAILTAIFAWRSSGWRPGSIRTKAETGDLLRFGANVTGFSFLNYLSRSMDAVMIARAYGATALGFYDRAYRLLLFPIQNINAPVTKVMVPLLSRMNGDPERLRRAFVETAGLLGLICIPGIATVVVVADEVLLLLLGPHWAAVAPIFTWLGIAGLMQTLSNATGWLFIAQNRTRELLHWGIYSSMTTLLSFAAGLPWGAAGVAAAYAISGWLVRLPVLYWVVHRIGPVRMRDLLLLQLPLTVAAALLAGVVHGLRMTGLEGIGLILCSGVLAYAIALATLASYADGRAILKAAWRLARSFRGPRAYEEAEIRL